MGAYRKPKTLNELDGKLNTHVSTEDGVITVRLHRTDIVRYVRGEHVTLNFGGWDTPTTKRRMNDTLNILGIPLRVGSDRGKLVAWNYETKESTPLLSSGLNTIPV